MSRKTKITLTVIAVILAAVLIGFIYDAIMTAVEKRNYPQKYEVEVAAASEKYGVPKHIIFAVIKTESNFDPDVKSSAGACGLMQLLPSTFSEMSGIADAERYIYDPQINIDAGTNISRISIRVTEIGKRSTPPTTVGSEMLMNGSRTKATAPTAKCSRIFPIPKPARTSDESARRRPLTKDYINT